MIEKSPNVVNSEVNKINRGMSRNYKNEGMSKNYKTEPIYTKTSLNVEQKPNCPSAPC